MKNYVFIILLYLLKSRQNVIFIFTLFLQKTFFLFVPVLTGRTTPMVSSKDNYIFMFYSMAMDANFWEFLRLRDEKNYFCC